MNLNQLMYFSVVARTGSYSRAAEQCGVSQPVVYRSVRSLERTCGIRLLERQGNAVQLTKAGRAVNEYAAQIASLGTRAEQAVQEEKDLLSGHISIGAATYVGTYLLPRILVKWMAEHPRVTISITHGEPHQVQESVLEGNLDFVLASGARWAPGLQKRLVFSDKLVVVAAPGHPLSKERLVHLSDLSNERLIVPFSGSSTREEVDRIEREQGVRLKVTIEVNRQDTIKQLCKMGAGIGILPWLVVTEEVADNQLCLLNVESFPRERPYFLVRQAGKALSAEMRSLLAAVESWAQERNKNVHLHGRSPV